MGVISWLKNKSATTTIRPLKSKMRNHFAVKSLITVIKNYKFIITATVKLGSQKLTVSTTNNTAHTKKHVVIKEKFASSYIEKLETRYKPEKQMLTTLQISFSHCEQTGQQKIGQ